MTDIDKGKVSIGVACLIAGIIGGAALEYTRGLNDSQHYADGEVRQLSDKIDHDFLRRETFDASVATLRADIAASKAEAKGDSAVLAAQMDAVRASVESLTRRMDLPGGH